YGETGKNYSFHNGVMDLLVVHGPYITLVLMLGMVASWVAIAVRLISLKRISLPREDDRPVYLLLLSFSLIGLINVSNILEAGYSDPVKVPLLCGVSLVAWSQYRRLPI